MKYTGVFKTDENTGVVEVLGSNRFAQPSRSGQIAFIQSGKCYISGMLINLSPVNATLFIKTDQLGTIIGLPLTPYCIVHFDRQPARAILVAVNGSIHLKPAGLVVDQEGNVDEARLLARSSVWIEERNPKNVPILSDLAFDVDISSATTTDIIGSATENFHIRPNKIYISVAGAQNVDLIYERNGVTHLFAKIDFPGAGFAIIDDPEPSYLGPQGAAIDTQLQAITSTAAATNISGSYAEE